MHALVAVTGLNIDFSFPSHCVLNLSKNTLVDKKLLSKVQYVIALTKPESTDSLSHCYCIDRFFK